MESLFLGVYWGNREEDRDKCAEKLSEFLAVASGLFPELAQWFLKSSRKKRALKPIDFSPEAIAGALRTNNRDTDGQPILELGFNVGLWNGTSASFSATVGASSRYVGNSVLLSFDGECPADRGAWKRLIEGAVHVFDPDSAVVTDGTFPGTGADFLTL